MEWRVESSIETARGNDCVVIRSEQGRYKYSKIRALVSGETRYRCTNRRCNVNVFLDGSNRVVRASNTNHSHPGLKPSQYTLVKLRTACKQFARENMGLKPVDELIREAYEIGAVSIPDSKKRLLKKAIHTAKRHVISCVLKGNPKPRAQKAGVLMDEEMRALCEDQREGEVFAEPVGGASISGLKKEEPDPHQLDPQVLRQPDPEDPVQLDPFAVTVKQERLEPRVKQEPGQELCAEAATQTDTDEDLKFLMGLLPSMKKLNPGDKSMMKAQIQQLFMWKLNKQ